MFEDFLDFSIKDLASYLSVCGLNTSGRKVELVAQIFAVFELKLNIIASSEEEKLKLESDYHEVLSKHGLMDPMLIDDITRWPVISIGNIFTYILEKKCLRGNI